MVVCTLWCCLLVSVSPLVCRAPCFSQVLLVIRDIAILSLFRRRVEQMSRRAFQMWPYRDEPIDAFFKRTARWCEHLHHIAKVPRWDAAVLASWWSWAGHTARLAAREPQRRVFKVIHRRDATYREAMRGLHCRASDPDRRRLVVASGEGQGGGRTTRFNALVRQTPHGNKRRRQHSSATWCTLSEQPRKQRQARRCESQNASGLEFNGRDRICQNSGHQRRTAATY